MPTDPSFQMTVQDIIPIYGSDIAFLGQIECGTLCVGDEVYIRGRNSSEKIVVMSIETSDKKFSQVHTGTFVALSLRATGKQKVKQLKIGDVLMGSDSEFKS